MSAFIKHVPLSNFNTIVYHFAISLRVKQKEKPEVLHIIYVKYHGMMNMVNSVVENSVVETV